MVYFASAQTTTPFGGLAFEATFHFLRFIDKFSYLLVESIRVLL
jgi:hypothetical protein